MDLTSTILKDNNKGSQTVQFLILSPALGLVTLSSFPPTPGSHGEFGHLCGESVLEKVHI